MNNNYIIKEVGAKRLLTAQYVPYPVLVDLALWGEGEQSPELWEAASSLSNRPQSPGWWIGAGAKR